MRVVQKTVKIAIIGGGVMGCCLLGGLLKKAFLPENILVADHRPENCLAIQKKWNVETTTDNKHVAALADILILAVKPQSMREVVEQIAPTFNSQKTLLISIAAGITTTQIQQWIQTSVSIVRAMPNTPALYGVGITGLFANPHVSSFQREQSNELLLSVGDTVWIADENLMDSVTALSGSGPAYFFYVMECLIKSAHALGLPLDIARKLTYQTALGSAVMALQSNDNIATLRENVTSPGGTTQEGINVLKGGKLEDLLLRTLEAATTRGKSLSKQYD